MFVQIALFAAQMALGALTRAGVFSKRPEELAFEELVKNNAPSEVRPVAYGGGTFQLTPQRAWYGDSSQRAVERDSHWSDYVYLGFFGALLDTLTVGYRHYAG